AIAWWCWKGALLRRIAAVLAGLGLTIAALALTGLGTGGGFTWLKAASIGTVASSFSIPSLGGTTASGPANLVQLLGICVAVLLVLAVPRGRSWIGALAVGFAVMALCAANPQPWYVLWALPLVACTLVDDGPQRFAILILTVMVAWSELPFGVLVWLAGIIALTVIWIRWMRSSHQLDPLVRPLP